MESNWLSHAKRLQGFALTGRYFSREYHEQERYRDIAETAVSMFAQLRRQPSERIATLVPDAAQSCMTPKADVRSVVIDRGRILLVQKKSDQLRALIGGFADVGLLAAEIVLKELREEARITSVARHVYAVRNKAKASYCSDVRDFYKLYFSVRTCRPDGAAAGSGNVRRGVLFARSLAATVSRVQAHRQHSGSFRFPVSRSSRYIIRLGSADILVRPPLGHLTSSLSSIWERAE